MAQPLHSYTPHGVRSIQGYSTEPKLTAGSRAQIRHGIASNHNPMSVSAHPGGLHQWDIALRNGTGSIIRDAFIKDTEDDMHDAAAALDRVSGGFTVILHCRGSVQSINNPPLPEEMQFTVYITRSEVEKHAPMFDAAVSRIAQIFAADVMPQQSRNYDAKCATSYVDVDKAAAVSRGTLKEAPLLVPPALFTSSTYVFQGYHPGYLESFLLRPLYNTVVGLRANPTAHTKIDYRTKGLPSPSTINKAILRIPAVNPQSSFNRPSSSLTPQVTAKRMAQLSRIDRLMSPGPDALFGAPIQSKLFVSQPPCTDESSSSVSSTSTIDYWDSEDESFSQGLDDAMSSTSLMDNSVSFKGKGRQHAVAAPRALSKLAPIISMGPETESALIAAGLPDTVHTYLRDLVGKRVTTGWILSLQNPPLSLSSEIAAAVSAAVHRDINNVH